MKKEHELLMCGEEAVLLTDEGKTVNLREAVSTLAIGLYANALDMWNMKNGDEKKELANKVTSQSKVLSVLSEALATLNMRY